MGDMRKARLTFATRANSRSPRPVGYGPDTQEEHKVKLSKAIAKNKQEATRIARAAKQAEADKLRGTSPVTRRRVAPTVSPGTRAKLIDEISVPGGKGNPRIRTRSFETRPANIASDNPAVYPHRRIKVAIKEDAFEPTPRPKSIKTQIAEKTEKRRRRFDRERSLRIKASQNARQYPLSHSEKVDRAKRITTNINNARAKLASSPKLVPSSERSVMAKPGGTKSDYPSEGGRIAMKYITKFGNTYKGSSLSTKSRSTQPGWAGLPIDLFF